MNIALSKEKKSSKIGYGLNRRGGNVLDESDSEEEEAPSNNNRQAVNRDILKEQEALRRRAQAAASSEIYDYDGAYDKFHPPKEEANKKKEEPRTSRYIGDLLKAAKQRERERDQVYERKIAKEQADEEEREGFQDKEKFVTKAYKRQLEERKLWEAEEEKKRLVEEREDVTKRKAGEAFGNFYGNLTRNVAMGGDKPEAEDTKKPLQETSSKPSFLDGFEPSSAGASAGKGDSAEKPSFLDGFQRFEGGKTKDRDETELKEPPPSPRSVREEKVKKARIRYFERHGISPEAIPAK